MWFWIVAGALVLLWGVVRLVRGFVRWGDEIAELFGVEDRRRH